MNERAVNSSPLYSELFSLTALLIISGIVLLLLRYYLPLRKTPAYLLIPIFFALFLPASLILLVPIDLASIPRDSTTGGNRGIWLPERIILISWRILYWETFFLTWFILPILAEYADAGYRDPKSRLIWSLKRNLVYHGVVFGSGLAVMIYFFISVGVTFTTLKGLVVATAYFWSLIFAIYLMGHGLVAIPRKLFRSANLSGRLEYLYTHAAKVYEKLTDAIFELEDLEELITELSRRKSSLDPKFQDWIEELTDESYLLNTKSRSHTQRMTTPESTLPRIITQQYLADLSRTLSRARHARAQFMEEWYQVVKSAKEIKETLEAHSGSKKIGKLSPDASFLKRLITLTPRTRFYFRYYLFPGLKRLLGAFFSLASFFIIWSELIKPINPLFSIIAVTIIHHPNSEYGEIGFAGQIIAASWILYMCMAALTSLTDLKVWRGRALVRRNTHGESAAWYSYQVARLSVPLAFNFMTFLDPDIYTRTIFYGFLGNFINLTPLSSWFDILWPTLIVFPVCATLFGLYGKIDNCIGYDELVDDEESHNGPTCRTPSWCRGRELIELELQGSSSARILQRSTTSQQNALKYVADSSKTTSAINFDRWQTSGPSSQTQSRTDTSQRSNQILGESSYETLWHRLKNTVENVPKSNWLQTVTDDIRIPKWITGNKDIDSDSNQNSGWLSKFRQKGKVRL